MSAPGETTTTEIETIDGNHDDVLASWGVKQEQQNDDQTLFEKSDLPSAPAKEILDDVTITDSLPHESIGINGFVANFLSLSSLLIAIAFI